MLNFTIEDGLRRPLPILNGSVIGKLKGKVALDFFGNLPFLDDIFLCKRESCRINS
jgi:hypothetical protein